MVNDGINMLKTGQNTPIWQQEVLGALQTRVDVALRHPLLIPEQAGGWVHQYVCPEHGLPLIFDITSPSEYRCPRGDVWQGENLDAAFRVLVHRHYAALARDAAFLYQSTGVDIYFKTAFEIISHYANIYEHFNGGENSQPWMLSGKAFHQVLTEAIWTVPLVYTFDIIQTKLTPLQVDFLSNKLLKPIARTLTVAHDKLVFQQNNLKSNYNAWLIAALGCIGFSLKDKSLIERAVHGAGGFTAHLNVAILPDGFEFEGTPYYHNFVALAYTLLAEMAIKSGVNLYAIQGEKGQSIEKMWSALAMTMWADGNIPSLNDGSYWQNSNFDAELCEVYEVAFARIGDPRYAWLLGCAYHRREMERDVWTALAFGNQDISTGQPPAMHATCLKEIGLAFLRDSTNPDGLSALLRFGPYGGSHTHKDCLALLVFPFSQDAGNPPYGVDIRHSWYQQSAAHNTVMVDGQSQAACDGRLISWVEGDDCREVQAASDNVYSGVKFSRKVTLSDGKINDQTNLRSDGEHIFDWLLHTDVALDYADFILSPAQGPLFPDGAGAFIQLTSKGICAEKFQATIKSRGKNFCLTLSSPNPLEIILARSPKRGGVDMDERYTLIGRYQGRETDFLAQYEEIK